METINTFGIQFIVRRNKVRNGMLPVYARITVNSRRVEISLKQFILPENWNDSKGIARGNSPEIRQLNQYLTQVHSKFTECYRQIQLKSKTITAEAVKNLFLGDDVKAFTLKKLIDYHNETMRGILAWGTLKNYFTTQKYIEKYLRERLKTSDINLTDLSYRFITDFEHYLRAYQPVDHHKPMANNGVMKHLERLRKMITMAVKMEWLEKDPFERFQLKFHKTSREFLTSEELSSIESKKLSIERLSFVRDLFVFSCYTGLAYIDAISLKAENIAIGIDGEYWITTFRQKTTQPVRIPLLPKALDIVDKYKTHPKALYKGTVFPVISNQKLNSYLKELADLCSITKPLTFHIARHTFATTVTLTNGVPIETVSKLLGHTDIKTTQIYAKIVEKKVSNDMMQLRQALNQQYSTNDTIFGGKTRKCKF